MAKAQATPQVEAPQEPSVADLMETIRGLASQVETLKAQRAEEDEDEDSPDKSTLSNANARLIATQVGDCLQPEGYEPPVPESVVEKGPRAVAKFLKDWNRGQSKKARSLGGEAAEHAEMAHM